MEKHVCINEVNPMIVADCSSKIVAEILWCNYYLYKYTVYVFLIIVEEMWSTLFFFYNIASVHLGLWAFISVLPC